MAKNEEVQSTLQDEIDRTHEESGKTESADLLDYNDLQSMPYLDMVVQETLRLHPSLSVTFRVCTKEKYQVSKFVSLHEDIIKSSFELHRFLEHQLH